LVQNPLNSILCCTIMITQSIKIAIRAMPYYVLHFISESSIIEIILEAS